MPWHRWSQRAIPVSALVSFALVLSLPLNWENSGSIVPSLLILVALTSAPFVALWLRGRQQPMTQRRAVLNATAAVICVAVAAWGYLSVDPNDPNGFDGIIIVGIVGFQGLVVVISAILADVR